MPSCSPISPAPWVSSPGRAGAGKAEMGVVATLVTLLMRAVIRGWQLLVSPVLPPACRYLPSCSHYAEEAIILHGPWRGGVLAARRLCRCHPWGGSGYDPVPAPSVGKTR